MTTIICTLSGAISEMKARDQRDPLKVLAVLAKNPRFTCFDATERDAIANSLDKLKRRGHIEYLKPGPAYPWCEVRVTPAGQRALEHGKG